MAITLQNFAVNFHTEVMAPAAAASAPVIDIGPSHSMPVSTNVRCYSDSDQILRRSEMPQLPMGDICADYSAMKSSGTLPRGLLSIATIQFD
jgi:hypothetical protein